MLCLVLGMTRKRCGNARRAVTACLAGTLVLITASVQIRPAVAQVVVQMPDTQQLPDSDEKFSETKVEVIQKGSSSRTLLRDAEQRLPLDSLTPENRQRVEAILQNRSMFRRLPQLRVDAEPEVYVWFTRNPEAAVGIWRVMGISVFSLTPNGPESWLADGGDGSQGTVEVIHRSPGEHLLLCDGEYKCPLLQRPIRAQALMHLRSEFRQLPDGRRDIVHDLDLFVAFPSQTVDTIAKVISPVSNAIADRNFRELSLFVAFMNYAMQKQPGWVEQMAQRLDGISQDQRRELMEMSARVYVAERRRDLQAAGIAPAAADQILPPVAR